jgi:hypothetical protein
VLEEHPQIIAPQLLRTKKQSADVTGVFLKRNKATFLFAPKLVPPLVNLEQGGTDSIPTKRR